MHTPFSPVNVCPPFCTLCPTRLTSGGHLETTWLPSAFCLGLATKRHQRRLESRRSDLRVFIPWAVPLLGCRLERHCAREGLPPVRWTIPMVFPLLVPLGLGVVIALCLASIRSRHLSCWCHRTPPTSPVTTLSPAGSFTKGLRH